MPTWREAGSGVVSVFAPVLRSIYADQLQVAVWCCSMGLSLSLLRTPHEQAHHVTVCIGMILNALYHMDGGGSDE